MPAKNFLLKVLTAGVLLAAFVARAEPDRFYLGSGRDGATVVSGADTVINRYAQVKAPIAPGDLAVLVDQPEGFAAGDLVMVLQTTGIVPSATPGDGSPVELSRDAVGSWELARVLSVDADVLYLSERLLHSYAAGVTQIIRVPEFTTVDIRPGARIVPQPWNGATGGVIAFLATGTITNEGAIDASGSGFRGGSYVRQTPSRNCSSPSAWMERGSRRGEGVDSTDPGQGSGRANIANGGGGGACLPSGGGGGGHGGPGGQGGQPTEGPRDVGGLGGARLVYSLLERLTLGGGGGGGSGWNAQYAPSSNGGQGGGAIFIRADALVGNGRIAARGEPGHGSEKAGAGGGGAGGIISLRVAGALQCASLDASGGLGGSNGATGTLAAGGGGGGGQVLYQAAWVSECAMSATASPAGAGRELSGAQPDFATLPDHVGTVTRLDGGLVMPGTVTILQPEYGALVRTRTPTISGIAPVGLEVVLYVDGLEVGRTVAEGGYFEWSVSEPLTEGLHHVQAAASYQGLQGEPSLPHLLVVSSRVRSAEDSSSAMMAAVTAPSFNQINSKNYSDGMLVNVSKPTITGSAAGCDSVTVEIRKSGALVGSALVDTCSGGNWSVTPSVFSLLDGTYSLSAWATKSGSNSSATPGSFVVDTTPPAAAVVLTPENGGYTNLQKPTFSGTAEPLSTIKVYLDGSASAMSTTPATVTTNASGAWTLTPSSNLPVSFHWFQVESTDTAGNVGNWSLMSTFTIDQTAPVAPVVNLPAGGISTNDTTPEISGTAEAGSTVTLYDNGTAVTPSVQADASGNWLFVAATTWSESTHSVTAKATDRAGNPSPVSTSRDLTIDVTPPQTTLGTVPPPLTNVSSLSIAFSSDDAGATFKCSTDGVSFTTCTSPYNFSSLSTTAYQFYVRAIDAAGNMDPTPASATWEVDRTDPDAPSITLPTAGAFINDATPEIRGMAEAKSTVTVYDNGTAVTPTATVVTDDTGNWTFVAGTTWSEASHTVTAMVTDRAGNTSVASVARIFTIDTTEPDTSLGTKPSNPDYSSAPGFSFTGSADPGPLTFECSLDGAAFAACSSPLSLSALGYGTHTFNVRAVDRAGNRDSSPASYTWVYDNRPTDTLIDTRPAAFSNATSVSFTFHSNKTSATFECKYFLKTSTDPGWTPCSSPFTTGALATGAYRFEVRATDDALNTDGTPASAEWDIDRTPPPTPSISSPAVGALLATNSFSVTGNAEGGTTVTVYIDGVSKGQTTADATTGNWSIPVSGVVEGVRSLKATSTDNAGNVDTATPDNTRSITVDTTPPNTLLDDPKPAPYSPVATATIRFSVSPSTGETSVSYQCKLDTGAEASCTSPWTVPATGTLSEGPHTVYVRATDAAGNNDLSPAEYTWVVDTVKPETFVDLKPPSRTGSRTVYFSFRSSESPLFRCALDGIPRACLSNHSVTITPTSSLPETHTLVVWAYDEAGNEDPTPESISWTLDENLPSVSIIKKPLNPTKEAQAIFEFSSSKSGVVYECLLDPVGDPTTMVTWPGCTNPFAFFVSDGSHVLWVRARDSLGNVTSVDGYVSAMWRVDTQRPDTVLETTTAPWTPEKSASFTFSSPDELSVSFDCTLNGVAIACTTPFTTPPLPDGPYTLSVTARDAAGNVDDKPATFSWTVDTLPPAAPTVTAPVTGATLTASNLVFEGTSEGMARVVVVLDGRELGSTTASETGAWRLEVAESLPDGAYQFNLEAYDRASNKSEISTALLLAIDATAPESIFLSGPEERQRLRTRDTTFRIGATEPATFTCSLDGQDPFACGEERFDCGGAACGTEVSLKDLSEGDHDLLVTARDSAGNKEVSSKVRRWRVYLGGDSKAMGGGLGLNCAAGGADAPSLVLLALAGLAPLLRRRRRDVASSTNPNRGTDKESV